MSAFLAVVLAAGQGIRMKSARPKVLHPLAGLPLVSHALTQAGAAGAGRCALVIPPAAPEFTSIAEHAPIPTRLFVQAERLGTAHAVLAARPELERADEPVLVLYGDTPLVAPASLKKLSGLIAEGVQLAVLGFTARDPKGYGRLLRDADGNLIAIREEKDATDAERAITVCNSGIMAFDGSAILPLLDGIQNDNGAREFYLTDAVAMARARGHRVACEIAGEDEVRGINTRAQLAEAEAIMQERLRRRAMEGGATLIAPETVTFCHDTMTGQDVLIEPHVIFGPGVVIEDEVTIKGFCHIEGALIEKGATVGPFARFRPGARIGPKARIGNFVEVKNATIHEGARAGHLSYIGDAEVGKDANIGAGTITCNYDGFHKHRTSIGAGVFTGSNSALVAPVTIGDGAYIGAGSVITKDVPENALAVERAPQVNREGMALRLRARRTKG